MSKIVGTWDALEDAAELLNKAGLAYILTAAMDGSNVARTRTNAASLEALDWMAERQALAVDKLREGWGE